MTKTYENRGKYDKIQKTVYMSYWIIDLFYVRDINLIKFSLDNRSFFRNEVEINS